MGRDALGRGYLRTSPPPAASQGRRVATEADRATFSRRSPPMQERRVPLVKCPDCGKEFSDSAASCPNCARPNVKAKSKTFNKSAFGCFVLVILGGDPDVAWRDVVHAYRQRCIRARLPPAPMRSPSWSLSRGVGAREYDYAIAEGTVKNVSSEPLSQVEVVVSFADHGGKFITSDDALIAYNPILPGQTSPFKAMVTDDPAIQDGESRLQVSDRAERSSGVSVRKSTSSD